MIRSSQAAIDLIVEFEVSSKAQYEKLYKYPTWPGGKSGVTIGIGYDLGYTDLATFGKNFGDILDAVDFHALAATLGKTGEAAKAALPAVKHIIIDWDDAMRVFIGTDLLKYENMLIRACPNAALLPGDCFGALTSIVYNRGAGGFHAASDRFKEMRTIAQYIASNNWQGIPAQIRAMKRLWSEDTQRGLLIRRDREAKLFEQGLSKVTQPGTTKPADTSATVSQDDFSSAMSGAYDMRVELVQRKLKDALGYFEVGEVDGRWGGRTRGAITAFMNDRHQPTNGLLTAAVMDEMNHAVQEGWKRPIADTRSQATQEEVAKKTPVVNQSFWQKTWALLLGVPSAAGGLLKYVFGDQGTPSGYFEPIKNAFQLIPPELYLLVVVGICIAIYIQAKRTTDTTVDAYRQGKIN